MRNYNVYRCGDCKTIFAIPIEFIDISRDSINCPICRKSKHITVIGAYDDLEECMKHDKYRRGPNGSIRQD